MEYVTVSEGTYLGEDCYVIEGSMSVARIPKTAGATLDRMLKGLSDRGYEVRMEGSYVQSW